MSDLTAEQIRGAVGLYEVSRTTENSKFWVHLTPSTAKSMVDAALAYADLLRVRECRKPRAVGGLGPHAEDDL